MGRGEPENPIEFLITRGWGEPDDPFEVYLLSVDQHRVGWHFVLHCAFWEDVLSKDAKPQLEQH